MSLLVRANEGRTLHAFGEAVIVLLDGTKSRGLVELGLRSAARGPFPDYEIKPVIAFSAN